jgi:hypothetical protein
MINRNELTSHEKTGTKLKCILLSERGQNEKVTYCMFLIIQHSEKSRTIEVVFKNSGCQ